MMLGGGYNHGYYNNYYSNNQCFGGCPPGAHCEWGFCECNRGRSSIHLSYLQPFMLRKITKVGYADVSAVAHRCASSAYWTKRIFPLLTHKLPFWIHFSKSLGSEPQLTNINYEEYVEVSSFCVNEAREFIRVFAMFDSSRLQITSDRNIISLNKSPDRGLLSSLLQGCSQCNV